MKMGIKTRTLAAVGIGCLALGAGAGLAGIYGYRNNEREGRISEILSGFKDRCRLVGSEPACFFDPPALEGSAKLHLASGEPLKAGIVYARIDGKGEEARKIAEKCEKDGDARCAGGIRDELSARAVAMERYFEQKAAGKAPPTASGR